MFCDLYVCAAHSAYTWDELAEAIRRSYVGINQVLVLKKFVNWSESIDPYLNEAAKTDGEFWLSGCSDAFVRCKFLSTLYALRLQALHWLPVLPFLSAGHYPPWSHCKCWHLWVQARRYGPSVGGYTVASRFGTVYRLTVYAAWSFFPFCFAQFNPPFHSPPRCNCTYHEEPTAPSWLWTLVEERIKQLEAVHNSFCQRRHYQQDGNAAGRLS